METKPSRLIQGGSHGPISRSVYSQGILEAMRLDILSGRLPVGQHLVERKLASNYDVSRGPIRDAMHLLEQEGLVETPRNGRTRVVGLQRKDAENLFNLRIQLESTALEQIDRPTEADLLRKIREAVSAFRELEQSNRDGAALDIAFHELVMTLPKNRPLMTAWQLFSGLFYAMLTVTNSATQDFQRIGEEHELIYDSIANGDPIKGIPVLTRHLETAKTLLTRRLEDLQEQYATPDGRAGKKTKAP